MKGNANNDAGFPRIPYFFCTSCNTRREAIDPGDVHPVCEVCHNRALLVRYEELSEVVARDGIPPVAPADDRPDDATPYSQPRLRERKASLVETLRLLVTDLNAALESPDTYHALLKDFNPFLREIVNYMVIERVDWRQAVNRLDKDFCLRHAKSLEEFKRWAENPAAVPGFLEPQTSRHEPLSEPKPPHTTPSA